MSVADSRGRGFQLEATLCVMPKRRNLKALKWVKLESPKTLYDTLLLDIGDRFGERQKERFEFVFRGSLPAPILESRNPLKWFTELERRGDLSPDDLSCLEDFFPRASLDFLLQDVHDYQIKRMIIVFFQEGVEQRIPSVRLGKDLLEYIRVAKLSLTVLACNLFVKEVAAYLRLPNNVFVSFVVRYSD